VNGEKKENRVNAVGGGEWIVDRKMHTQLCHPGMLHSVQPLVNVCTENAGTQLVLNKEHGFACDYDSGEVQEKQDSTCDEYISSIYYIFPV
jgi:hypothetical protein